MEDLVTYWTDFIKTSFSFAVPDSAVASLLGCLFVRLTGLMCNRLVLHVGVYQYTGKGNISADKWNIGGPDISADLIGPIFFSADISVNRHIDYRQQCCGPSCNE